jgi:hypothetical protein
MYFSEEHIFGLNRRRTSHAHNPGLGFAWLHTDRPARGIDEQLLENGYFDRREGAATAFLDLAIRGYGSVSRKNGNHADRRVSSGPRLRGARVVYNQSKRRLDLARRGNDRHAGFG